MNCGFLAKLGGVVLIATLIWNNGNQRGQRVNEARHQAAIAAANERVTEVQRQSDYDAARLIMQAREARELVDALTQDAQDDPNASRPALGVSSVRRLNSLTD